MRWRALAVPALLLLGGCAADPATPAADTAAPSVATAGDGSTSETSDAEAAPVTESSDIESSGADGTDILFPDVIDASATLEADGTWTFDATLSSPYDSPARYADAWRVVGPDGTVFGIRELAHDHAAEQPFTRSQGGIVIPDDVELVIVEGRDQISGWGGATVEVALAH